MKLITLDQLKDKHYGNIGTPKRDNLEQELKVEIIREEIKRLRKQQNLTQEQLGAIIGVQKSQISKLENNTSNMTIGTLMKVLNALNAQIKFTIYPQENLV